METNPHIRELFEKFLSNSINKDEYKELLNYFGSVENDQQLRNLILQDLEADKERNILEIHSEKINQTIHRVREKIDVGSVPAKKHWLTPKINITIAAAVLLISGVFAYYYISQSPEQLSNIVISGVEDIDPGTNRATLTLENSSPIVLNEDRKGIVMGTDGISYDDGTKIAEHTEVQYALLTTPRKGQYQTILSDGTKVWLNAESSIRYPTTFTGNVRKVELTGEAYFEVAHNANQPFVVQTQRQQVKVLGTVFNIKAYSDAETTTLISGSVAVKASNTENETTLLPNTQAVVANGKITTRSVDVSDFTGWKVGRFQADIITLRELTKDIERWYDVEFIFPDNYGNTEKAFISINRREKLSKVLHALELTYGVQFRIEGKEVYIR